MTDGIIDPVSVHLCDVDWERGQLAWRRLCTHGSSFLVQDVHPHPIFSHDDRFILFTSDPMLTINPAKEISTLWKASRSKDE